MIKRHRQHLVLLILAAVCVAWTFMRPSAVQQQHTYRYVYFFDISQSMNVTDMGDEARVMSRLQAAKRAAIESAKTLPCGSEIGLGLFTGHRIFLLVTPVETCANFTELLAMIEQVDWKMTWQQRSEIAKGLHKGIKLLASFDEPTRIVFFTDGHEAPPTNPDLPPKFRGEKGQVPGLLVGVGGDTPAPIPKFDEFDKPLGFFTEADLEGMRRHGRTGLEHLSSLRGKHLEMLARNTGLEFHRLESDEAFLQALQRPAYGIPVAKETDIRPWFALAALALLLISTVSAGSLLTRSKAERTAA